MAQNKKGSILIYTLFISSFIALFFVAFQGTIEKTMERTKNSEITIRSISSIHDALITLKNSPSDEIKIEDSNISVISLTRTEGIFTESLNGDSSREYWITSTGSDSLLSLVLTEDGPISYSLAGFNSGSEAYATIVSSGFINTINNNNFIDLSGSLDTHILVIDPLGGRVKYSLDTGSTITIPASSSYKIERTVNGYKKYEGTHEITHFLPKSRAGFNYTKMGMYLKE